MAGRMAETGLPMVLGQLSPRSDFRLSSWPSENERARFRAWPFCGAAVLLEAEERFGL